MNTIILASASPRRLELMKNAGFDPLVMPASVMETVPFSMAPETTTMFLALKKAFGVYKTIKGNMELAEKKPELNQCTVVAADTVVVSKCRIIGKPADREEAEEVLKSLRGTSHHVITGCCIVKFFDAFAKAPLTASIYEKRCFFEDTEVFFKNYTDREIRRYIKTDEPYDKAGGYAIQGTFSQYVDHIDGDYDNVIGLPLKRVMERIG